MGRDCAPHDLGSELIGVTVVLYSHTSRIGGAEVAAPSLAREIGAELWIRGEGKIAEDARSLGLIVKTLPSGVDTRPLGIRGHIGALLSVLRSQLNVVKELLHRTPSLVVSNTIQGSLHVALPSLITRTPLLVYVRDLGRGGNRPAWEIRLYELILRLCADGIIFNSQLTAASWALRLPSLVVHTAIEERFFAGNQSTERNGGALMVGRLAKWKGQAEVVDALSLLADRGICVPLTLAGDTAFGDLVRLPTARIPIRRLGFIDPLDEMRTREVLVHASVTPEPLGQVLAQAAASGIPIVCARLGGHTEWLEDGVSCLMADPRDPVALGAAIEEAITNPASSLRRAQAARTAVERFRIESAYRELRLWLGEFI